MSIEQLGHIKGLLDETFESESSPVRGKIVRKLDEVKLRKEVRVKAKDLHNRLELFHEIMGHQKIGNRLNLGTSFEEINWGEMPGRIAACFKPEFDYQPEEIRGFYISSADDIASSGGRSLKITLERDGRWWSYISSGAIVRKGYHGGVVYAHCSAGHGQPKLARESMKQLKESLWNRELERKQNFLMHDINELELCEEMLKFATAELGIQALSS